MRWSHRILVLVNECMHIGQLGAIIDKTNAKTG